MKKTYSKPEINFDSFGISSNFANTPTACAYQPDAMQMNSCGYTIAGRSIFVESNTGCNYVAPDGAYGVCYYIPTGDSNIFVS